jgi:hypothetical protein
VAVDPDVVPADFLAERVVVKSLAAFTPRPAQCTASPVTVD